MINIEKAEKEFKKYASNFDMNESNIERKLRHTFRVEKICEELAIILNMNEEEINLSKLIGLLHDIARFDQYTIYNTFNDLKSIDHGDLGVKILEKHNYIRKYIETDKYDGLIKKAILNHNKYAISNNVTEEEKIYCQIIRDADKIDIMYEATCEFWKKEIEEMQEQYINPKALEQFMEKQVVNKKYITKDIDINNVLIILAFIYDFNIQGSYRIIKENDYINKMINRFEFKKKETKEQIELIIKIANDYINSKVS